MRFRKSILEIGCSVCSSAVSDPVEVELERLDTFFLSDGRLMEWEELTAMFTTIQRFNLEVILLKGITGSSKVLEDVQGLRGDLFVPRQGVWRQWTCGGKRL